MANGLSDILSVYRQSLTSERQSRQTEMQIALQAMQYESAQQFREEGRQREDIMGALEFASQSTSEALGQDTSQIYSKILNLAPILEADWDAATGAIESSNKVINKLKKLGYSAQDATEVVTIANTYGLASKNPKLSPAAQSLASDFGKRVSRDYSIWKESGFVSNTKGYQPKSPLIKAMEKSGLMYKGGDQLQRDISVDAFIGVGDALTALDNIKRERMEIGSGDYTIDRSILVGDEFDIGALADEANVSIGAGVEKEGGMGVNIQNEISAGVELGGIETGEYGVGVVSDEDIMKNLDFLPKTDQENIEKQLMDLNDVITNKIVSLDLAYTERDDRVSEYNLMQGQYDKFEARREYFYKLEGRKGENYTAATKELFALEKKMRSSVEAKEVQVSTGYRSGTMGKGNLAQGVFGENPQYENTYSKDIIKLSQEIEDLNRKKMNFAPR